jgi:hypothetical protein
MMHYSDPARETDVHALPNIEVFWANEGDLSSECYGGDPLPAGFYYWYCFPGCMPDSEPCGPYETEDEALAAARAE